MSGSDRQPHQRQPGRPATVTIKTVIERRFPPSDHMLAEHDLQQATRFRGACGHIPSSQLFEIDAVRCASRLQRQTGTLSFRTFLSDHRPGAPCGTASQTMVETDGIEPTT